MLDLIPNFIPLFNISTSTLLDYYDMGGFVMLPLIVVSILLWYALIYRAMNIRSAQHNPRDLVRRAKKGKKKFLNLKSNTAEAARFAMETSRRVSSPIILKTLIDEEFSKIKEEMSRHRMLVRSLIGVAPLLGLLGTVDGMIETFNSLGDMALFSQSGGIAGGISKALFTTQMGLAISIPGLMIGRVIERKERNIYRELDQIRDLVCARAKEKSDSTKIQNEI
jgi:biopolymer transport protein ExbB